MGEAQAYRDCYDTHAPVALAILVKMLRDRTRAEEILQETFVAVFNKIGQYRGDAKLVTWINGIAVRRALNALRDESRRPTIVTAQEPEIDAEVGEESQMARRDLARRVLGLLDRLPDEKRVAILLFAEGYTASEIATITNAPRGTVLARLARGRADLASLAAGAGIAVDNEMFDELDAGPDLERSTTSGARADSARSLLGRGR
jgi:RNA polymerase sigma-70 factor (ECF subfamily)